jgi:ketosteroid isomerase-like protein
MSAGNSIGIRAHTSVNKNKSQSRHSESSSAEQPPSGTEADELYRNLQPEMRRAKPGPDAIAAAMDAAQRLAAEASAEDAAADFAQDFRGEVIAGVCQACGYHNRSGNKFCGMCGAAVESEPGSATRSAGEFSEERRPRPIALHPNPFLDPEPESDPGPEQRRERHPTNRTSSGAPSHGSAHETHHYHHHYHYFTGGQEGMMPRGGEMLRTDPARGDSARDDKFRPNTAALRGDMSRAEAAVRRITQEWVLACNTKHLDDLLDLYVADALVLRSNYPPVRGAAAVREFFYGALDAGLGDIEIEPLRVEVAGDMAYEAGRCKALVPSATGKRREERSKYVWVCARQPNGEWKLAVDCWSSDLSLTNLESDAPPSGGVRSSQPRKS